MRHAEQITEALLREEDFKKLPVGTKVHYTGDAANSSGNGVIVKLNPPDRFYGTTYDIKMENGHIFKQVHPQNFGTHGIPGGHRFEIGHYTGTW